MPKARKNSDPPLLLYTNCCTLDHSKKSCPPPTDEPPPLSIKNDSSLETGQLFLGEGVWQHVRSTLCMHLFQEGSPMIKQPNFLHSIFPLNCEWKRAGNTTALSKDQGASLWHIVTHLVFCYVDWEGIYLFLFYNENCSEWSLLISYLYRYYQQR